MKLAEWARRQGLDDKTAYRWFRAGILPVPSKQFPPATILVEPVPLAEKRGAAVYARVSSGDAKQARHANRPQHCSEEVFGKWDKCPCFKERLIADAYRDCKQFRADAAGRRKVIAGLNISAVRRLTGPHREPNSSVECQSTSV